MHQRFHRLRRTAPGYPTKRNRSTCGCRSLRDRYRRAAPSSMYSTSALAPTASERSAFSTSAKRRRGTPASPWHPREAAGATASRGASGWRPIHSARRCCRRWREPVRTDSVSCTPTERCHRPRVSPNPQSRRIRLTVRANHWPERRGGRTPARVRPARPSSAPSLDACQHRAIVRGPRPGCRSGDAPS